MEEIAEASPGDQQPGQEIEQEYDAQHELDGVERGAVVQEGGDDEEGDRREVEQQQPGLEPDGIAALAFIEPGEGAAQLAERAGGLLLRAALPSRSGFAHQNALPAVSSPPDTARRSGLKPMG